MLLNGCNISETVHSTDFLLLQIEKGERKTNRSIWNHPGNDITGIVARSEKVVNTCEAVSIKMSGN